MSIHQQDETSRSGPHRRVESILDKMRIGYESEYHLPPYWVDIYINEWHIGIEVDGPNHSPKKDAIRDEILKERYFLPILRLKSMLSQEEIMTKIEDFIILHAHSGSERKHQYLVLL